MAATPCALAIQAAHALEAAHAAGLVHRDLKPANLFLTTNGDAQAPRLRRRDGAVGRRRRDEKKRQKGFAIFGTPEYMAPEQVAGEPVDARSDVYALGCVLYEMLTGYPPFSGKSSVEVLGKQVRESVDPPSTRSPERKFPEALEDVVLRAMSKKREERYPSAVAMRRALEDVLETGDAPKVPPRKRSMAVRGLAIVGALGAIVLVSHAGSRSAPSPKDVPAESVAMVHPAETAAAAPVLPDPTATAMQAPFVQPPQNDEPTPAADKPPKQDRAHERLASARSAARAKPDDAKTMHAWVRAAMRAGELREARRAADTWILHDSSPEPRIVLATVLDASGKRAEARAILEGLLESHPDNEAARKLHAKLGAPLPPPDTAARRSQVAERE